MMTSHKTMEQLKAGLDLIRRSPADDGRLELIVCRPAAGERRVLEEGTLDLERGLVGDNWLDRGSSATPDKRAHPERQLTIMNSRVIALLAGSTDRWPLAGDQLYVDLDLSVENLPPGSRLTIGTAVVEITPPPHTGCAKFTERFGVEAATFLAAESLRNLRLRGINARVITAGTIRRGDRVTKLEG